jgi:4-hydroxy-tetrahydrodipicolinate synthase
MNAAAPSRTFGSVSVAMVTPFHADGTVDVPTAQQLAVDLVDAGCDSLVVNGTTGESSTTHQPEKDALVRGVVEAVGERAMVIAGAGALGALGDAHGVGGVVGPGAHGLLVVTPYYSRPSQAGVVTHIRTIADSTGLPVMLYDIPGRTGVAIGDDALDRLAEHPRIVAVKDATGDVPHGFERMARTGLEFYSGDDGLNFAWLAHGASGVVSVVGHLAAGAYAEMVARVDDGDLVAARAVANRARGLVNAIMGGGQGAVMVKEALHLQGRLPSPAVRLPLVRAAENEIAALETVLRQEGLL